MHDLGSALSGRGPSPLMLGGGNPAHIPELERLWAERLQAIASDGELLRRTTAIYDPPRGNTGFLEALADLLHRELAWDVTAENIAITPGGQTAFYFLFNLFGGTRPDGSPARIHFPLVPEYIGYADQGLEPGMFTATRPWIETLGDHRFKYAVDFSALAIDSSTSALCVSRPTNPSGNLLTDAEMRHLADLAALNDIPLLIDNAYGLPFPGVVHRPATSLWTPHTVHVMSLSKFGLPGTRTAFVVGPPEIAQAVSSMMAVTGLANGNFGQAMTAPLVANGEIARLSREVVQPFYRRKRDHALDAVARHFPDSAPYRLHECEGAFFLWLWMEGSRRPSREIYEALKADGVLVVPGEYFFFGDPDPTWRHRHECLRISFAMDDATVDEGLARIARCCF